MKTFETTFITLDSGISVWLSPNASPAEVEALLKNALSYETRKVVRAEDGFTLKRGDTDLGSQVWL